MLEGVNIKGSRPGLAARLLPFLMVPALMLPLRLNAEHFAAAAGPAPFLFAVTGLLAFVFHLRAPGRSNGEASWGKRLAGFHLVVLLVFAPLWVGTGDASVAAMLLLPLVVYLAWATASPAGDRDGKDPLVRLLSSLMPERMAPLAAAELRLLAMALLYWRRPRAARQPCAFTSACVLTPMLLAVAALGLVETAVLHLVLAQWSGKVAWVATGVGLFSLVYIVGLAKSLLYLPSRVEPDMLLLRLGHFQRIELPYEAILDAGATAPCPISDPDTLNLAVMSSPNVVIELNQIRSTVALSGRRRNFNRVALKMDNAEGFLALLKPQLKDRATV